MEGLLRSIIYLDLVGLDETRTKEKLLAWVGGGIRPKPETASAFPGPVVLHTVALQGLYPGKLNPQMHLHHDGGISREQAVALCARLRDLLEAGEWKEADQETARMLLSLTHRQTNGWLRERDIKRLPCSVLRVIDELWQHYSNHSHRFGFSAQRDIWTEIQERPGKFDFESFCRFSDRVGWRVDEQWRRAYDELLLTSEAPAGHLPSLRFPDAEREADRRASWQDSFKHFLARVEDCL